ncbi:hypothetical protein JQ543_11570 [Bradyrhizobium diazoefficiens]|nr:hypothetical protein [Bradyrhizobium diazoefficiens]MBR0848380.1 hypothetical protein [Bradyrhizobium diazoefficiens]
MVIKPITTSPATIFFIMATVPGDPFVMFEALHSDRGLIGECAPIAACELDTT